MRFIVDQKTSLFHHGNYQQGELTDSIITPQALFIWKDTCFAGYVVPYVKVSVPDQRTYAYYKDTTGLFSFPKTGSLNEKLDACFSSGEPFSHPEKPVSIMEIESSDPDMKAVMDLYSHRVNIDVYNSRKVFKEGTLAELIDRNILDFYCGLFNSGFGRNLVITIDGHLEERYYREAIKGIKKEKLFLPCFYDLADITLYI